jgi:small GTP-binding protein
MSLLSASAQDILQAERRMLHDLGALLRETDAPAGTVRKLEDMADGLDALFLVVVVGEFNAGKSTVLNALFGETVMEEGPIPTTAKITLLRHGDEPLTRQRSEHVTERRVPVDLLRHLTLVDTPGTNSIVQEHQRITEDFVPRSDLVLFITSFDRPLTESERQFLSYIRDDWGRQIVVVVNKADLADSESDRRQVVDYVQTNCAELLDVEPRVVPVSAKQARRAKAKGDDALWAQSGFQPLEDLFTDTLAGPSQVALKLQAPLETAQRLLRQTEARLDERRTVLDADHETLDRLRAQLDDARTTLTEDYQPHLADVEQVFAEVRRRGVQFLDDTIRVSRIGLLRDRETFRQQFEEQVVQETTRQVERVVTDAVDDLLSRTMELQQDLFQTFAERVRDTRREGRFAADRGFAYDRKEVFGAIMDEAEREIRTHDLRHEVGRIVDNVYNDANLVVGAGLGAGVAGGLGIVLLVASALDAVGGLGLATGTVAALYGATVLPRQRRKAIDEFTDRIDALRGTIQDALQERLDDEIASALDRVWTTVEPFASFVEAERESLKAARDDLQALRETVGDLQARVETEADPTADVS